MRAGRNQGDENAASRSTGRPDERFRGLVLLG